MGAIRLTSLAFLTVPCATGRFDGEGREIGVRSGFMHRKVRVTGLGRVRRWRSERGAGIGEDGGGVGPVEENVERDTYEHGHVPYVHLIVSVQQAIICSVTLPLHELRTQILLRLTSTKTAQVVRP